MNFSSQKTLRALVRDAQDGNEGAFTLLYDGLYDKVYGYIYRRCSEACSAEDATSNVFYKMMTQLPSFRWQNDSSFYAWVFRIAFNEVNDIFRANGKCVLMAEWLEVHDDHQTERAWQHDIDRELANNKLMLALTSLDQSNRQIVELYYFAQLDHKTIAKIVGKREGAVRVALHRTLKRLRDTLEQQGEIL